MAQMDHNDAVRLQAAEKYVLASFPGLRDEYEEHFFDCAECAVDLKAAAAFVDVTAKSACRPEKLRRGMLLRPGRLVELVRPVIAVPAFAVLCWSSASGFVTIQKPRKRPLAGVANSIQFAFSARGQHGRRRGPHAVDSL